MTSQKHWALVAAAWGDVICSLNAVKEAGIRKVIYFGFMEGMKEFLEAQTFIDRVYVISSRELGLSFDNFSVCWDRLLHHNNVSDDVLAKILKAAGCDVLPEEVLNACMDITQKTHPLQQVKNIKCSENALKWLRSVQDSLPANYFLVNPYSFQSATLEDHWPHWDAYLAWLFRQEAKFVVCGEAPNSKFYGMGNVVNLCGVTPSADCVMALAQQSRGVITTINNLAHFCNGNDIRALVLHNAAASRAFDYFDRILTSGEVYDCHMSATLSEVQKMTRHLFDFEHTESHALKRDFWAEDSQKMSGVFAKLPFILYEDLTADWGMANDNFDVVRGMAAALRPKSYYEIGARLGHSIISMCAGNPDILKIGWCDNESYVAHSNDRVVRNLRVFYERYRDGLVPHLEYTTDINLAYHQMRSYDAIMVDGEHTRAGKIRDLDIALACRPKYIMVDDYFFLPLVRNAIREWAQTRNIPLHIVHTYRGMAFFDLTADLSQVKLLRDHGINCDLLSC